MPKKSFGTHHMFSFDWPMLSCWNHNCDGNTDNRLPLKWLCVSCLSSNGGVCKCWCPKDQGHWVKGHHFCKLYSSYRSCHLKLDWRWWVRGGFSLGLTWPRLFSHPLLTSFTLCIYLFSLPVEWAHIFSRPDLALISLGSQFFPKQRLRLRVLYNSS